MKASVTSGRGLRATEMIIKHLEKIDRPPGQEEGGSGARVKEEDETFGDLTLFDVSKDEEEETTTLMEDEEED